jgi:cytochrome c556
MFLLAGLALAQGPAYKEAAKTSQLMDGMVRPAQMAINAAAKEAPADDKAWKSVATTAALLQESGQLLKTTGRAKDQDVWMKDADALITAAAAVQKAAEAKDHAALQAAAGGIGATCQGCHRVYRYPQGQKKQ